MCDLGRLIWGPGVPEIPHTGTHRFGTSRHLTLFNVEPLYFRGSSEASDAEGHDGVCRGAGQGLAHQPRGH